jgi:hypothetical protein
VVVIEHHLDLLAEADYVIELGPEGGPNGGQLLYQGPLAGLLKVKGSPTAPFLRQRKYGLVGRRRVMTGAAAVPSTPAVTAPRPVRAKAIKAGGPR